MKQSPLVNNYKNKPRSGLEVMKEQSSFMVSKMMDIEDIIDITYTITPKDLNDYNIYTNNGNVVMMNFLTHKNKFTYDDIKKKHIRVTEDDSQNEDNVDYNTKWKFVINTKGLLEDYLFDEIFVYNKMNNDFNDIIKYYENIGEMNPYKTQDLIKDYIAYNVLDRYQFKTVRLYTEFHNLDEKIVKSVTGGVLDNDVKLYIKKPIFDIKSLNLKKDNIQTVSIKQNSDGIVNVYYKQKDSSKLKTFLYYMDVVYEKI